jgi:hypothetical protein
MAKVKKFAMGGMNLNRPTLKKAPPPSPRPISGSGLSGLLKSRAAPTGQAQQPPTKSLAGMGAAMRSGSGLTPMPVARQSQQSPVSSGSMMGAFQPVVRAPGQPVQVQNTSGTPAGLAQGAPSGLGAMGGYSGPIPQSRAMTDSETAAHTAAFDKMRADVAALPKMTGFGNIQPVKAQQSPMGMKKGGSVKSSASKRGDGIAQRGKTRGKLV